MSDFASLHVLMVSDVFFPRINGVSTSIETFRRDLAALGIRVTLVAPDYPPDPHNTEICPHLIENTHLHLVRIPAKAVPFDPEDRLMHWGKLNQQLAQLISAPGPHPINLIHIQTPFAAHLAAIRQARRHQIPVVATYHTHFEEYIAHYLPILPRPLLKHIARTIARRQCNDLNGVIVPSRPMRETLDHYGITAPMHVMPTGIRTELFRQGNRAKFRQAHQIEEHRKVALFVGRAAHEKNIEFLIRAAAEIAPTMSEFLLLIAGEGPALPSLQRLSHHLGLEAHVRFVGYMDREQALPDCYAAADVFAFASLTETQGLVVLEAMAASLPVYAIPAMGVGEIIAPGLGAVAAPADLSPFAQGLMALLKDRPRLAALGDEARLYAESWSAPERARQLALLYQTLTAPGTARETLTPQPQIA